MGSAPGGMGKIFPRSTGARVRADPRPDVEGPAHASESTTFGFSKTLTLHEWAEGRHGLQISLLIAISNAENYLKIALIYALYLPNTLTFTFCCIWDISAFIANSRHIHDLIMYMYNHQQKILHVYKDEMKHIFNRKRRTRLCIIQ